MAAKRPRLPGRSSSTPAQSGKKKERKPRKPPVERAVKLAAILLKRFNAITRNVNRWSAPEATQQQREACVRIAANLGNLAAPVDAIVADLAFLQDSKFSPKGAAPGRKALGVGSIVELSEARYDKAAHGAVNSFEVVAITEKYIQIRAEGDLRAPTHSVPRAWLRLTDLGADVDGDAADDDDEANNS